MDLQRLENLIGSLKEYKNFEKDFVLGNAPCSVIINSTDDVLALAFANKLSKLICSDVAAQNCDILTYGNGKNGSFLVENCKDLIAQSYLLPVRSDYKVFIINGGELSATVQNKLLKTIEEPPKNVFFFFITNSFSSFLPTVLSRCSKINLNLLSLNNFAELGFNKALYLKCGGSLSFAQKLGDKKFEDKFSLIVDCLKNMQKSGDVVLYSRKLAKTRADFVFSLEIFEHVFNLMLKSKIANTEFFDCELLNEFSAKAISYVIDEIVEAEKKLKFNCLQTAVCDVFLLKILEVKYKCKKGLL